MKKFQRQRVPVKNSGAGYSALLLLAGLMISASCGSSLKSEARREAEKYWLSKLTKCGDSYYRRERYGERTPTPGRDVYYELKEPKAEVSEDGVTDADKLNGLEWAGTTYLSAHVSRSIGEKEPLDRWSEWSEGPGLEGDVTARMRKEKGRWVVEDYFEVRHAQTGIEFAAVDCSKVPK